MSDKEELALLKQTFKEFIKTSGELKESYDELKEESIKLSLYLSNILENMDSGIMVFDNQMKLNLWNSNAERHLAFLTQMTPPVDIEKMKANTPFDIYDILQHLKSKVDVDVEIEGETYWLQILCSKFINNKGIQTGYLLVIRDITELRKLQIKSQQEDRLRVMGELAAEVAHEIRNPLGSIELMVSLLQEDLKEESKPMELISRIRNSVNNMNHIVSNILLYTRNLQLKPSTFQLAKILSEAEAMVVDTLVKKEIRIEKKIAKRSIQGDFELLKQGIANVLINAAQAVKPKGLIQLRAKIIKDHAVFEIQDDGPGISDKISEKIFNPFFTTKNTGTGLGLAMVKRVIETHGGTITFKSEPRKGTLFKIQIPLK